MHRIERDRLYAFEGVDLLHLERIAEQMSNRPTADTLRDWQNLINLVLSRAIDITEEQ